MGEARESSESQGPLNGLPEVPHRIGAACITARGPGVELHFPPLRATGSALMLALFGAACSVIGIAAIAGLLRSSGSVAATLLALSFAGVFALPLVGLGLWFLAIAIWTAANSLIIEIGAAGLQMERRCFGFLFARHTMPSADITAIDAQPAAKYIGVFGAVRYYRLFARGRNRALLVADSLKGQAMAGQMRNLIIERLQMPGLAATSNKISAADGNET